MGEASKLQVHQDDGTKQNMIYKTRPRASYLIQKRALLKKDEDVELYLCKAFTGIEKD